MLDAFSTPAGERLALTLLHFLWQGTAIAAVTFAVLGLARPRQSHVRYAVTLAALGASAIVPLITFATVSPPPETAAAHHREAAVEAALTDAAVEAYVELEEAARGVPQTPNAAEQSASRTNIETAAVPTDTLAPVRPWILTGWLCGVLAFSLRLAAGALALEWLTRRGSALPERWRGTVERFRRRLGLRRAPRMLVSSSVGEALAAGLWRPVVVLPAAWLARLPAEVIEAVIAHELVHIRRRDAWVNLFVRAVETVLFY
ncbi:MAG: M48 family metalloprotease, partial [Planctomycetes bacterium]|nr:M48 family metalloprotease [Planctomycetota bacterium]